MVPIPERTLAVICGASDWPRLRHFEAAPAFMNSAQAIRDYIHHSKNGLNVPPENMLWLFNIEDAVSQYGQIDDFLTRRLDSLGEVTGTNIVILFVYVGHGAFFGTAKEYCLLIRDTRAPIEAETSLRVATLSRLLRAKAPASSRILVLDCCFAGEAARSFQSNLDQAVLAKASEVIERAGTDRGVALLCASSSRNPARLDSVSSYTLFGRELVQVLTNGDPQTKGPLNLRRVCDLVRRGLASTGGEDAPTPEVHVPDQVGGDLAAVPLFPNLAPHVDEDGLAELRSAVTDQQVWKRIGAFHLVGRLLGSVRESTRDQARSALLDLTADTEPEVARQARALWYQRGLGEIPTVSSVRRSQPQRNREGKFVVGIDFGTTNSAVGMFQDGDVHIIPNAEGTLTTPSVVSIAVDGTAIVGSAAQRQASISSDYTVRSVKLRLGTDWSIERGGVQYSAEDIASLILRKLRTDAEAYAEEAMYGAVLTAPAYFQPAQRHALVRAAAKAGITVLRLVNEPTTATMTYGLGYAAEATVLIVDLGGGTFDVSLLKSVITSVK